MCKNPISVHVSVCMYVCVCSANDMSMHNAVESCRDATKFGIQIRQRLNFERIQQIRNLSNLLSALLSNANSWRNLCSMIDFICTESLRVQTNLFFSQIQPITQTTVIECAT